MSYNITRKTNGDFDAVVARVKDALKSEGFRRSYRDRRRRNAEDEDRQGLSALPHPRRLQPELRLRGAQRRAAHRRHAALQRHRAAFRERRGRGVVDRSGGHNAERRQRQARRRREQGARRSQSRNRQNIGVQRPAKVLGLSLASKRRTMSTLVQVFGRRHHERRRLLRRPASKKRQGTKSRGVWPPLRAAGVMGI